MPKELANCFIVLPFLFNRILKRSMNVKIIVITNYHTKNNFVINYYYIYNLKTKENHEKSNFIPCIFAYSLFL